MDAQSETVPITKIGFKTESARRLAHTLLDQQMWCFGCDVRLTDPHALLEWGFDKYSPPEGSCTPSHYRWEGDRGQVGLWGFGIWFAKPSWGSLLLQRGRFQPEWSAKCELQTNIWRAWDLKGFRQPHGATEHQAAYSLLTNLTYWLADYEFWVHQRYGISYRNRVVADWATKRKATIPAEQMPRLWGSMQAEDFSHLTF